MHPARSIILFTTLSGAGFGLLAWLGLGFGPSFRWAGFVMYVIGFALAGAGLIASTFHLGHPERALKAFTQWRSSWLSREAVLATITFAFLGLHVLLSLFGSPLGLLGIFGGLLALVTVFATSMIYMSLRTVPRWNHWSPPVVFLTYALTAGALLSGNVTAAGILFVALGVIQIAAWVDSDRRDRTSDSDMATATGLGDRGTVRAFESPHTGENYLTQEMVFRVGRKHATKLRVIAAILAAGVPFIILTALPFTHVLVVVAILSHLAGAYVSRWLFFAEARHVVGLYYGR